MADIFISYARHDRGKIEKLAAALEESGLTVWWDKSIATGDSFSEVIQSELELATAVIVAWSSHSLHSDWVKDEAHYAKTYKKYFPIKLDDCSLPLGFQQFQTFDLSEWRGNISDSILKNLIGELFRKEAVAPAVQPEANQNPIRWKCILTSRYSLFFIVSFFAVMIAVVALWRLQHSQIETDEPSNVASTVVPTIAVLPFTFLGDEEMQRYLAEGLSAEILHRLAEIDGLRVIGRTSSFSIGENAGDLREIGMTLGATHILEGSILKIDDKLRINAQLVDVRTGVGQWVNQFDRETTDFFAVQDEISQSVANALALEFIPLGNSSQTVDANAYDLYLRALHAWRMRWPEGRANGAVLLEQAIALDPTLSDARGLLALNYSGAIGWKMALSPETEAIREKAIQMAESALGLDPQNAFAQTAIGSVRLQERRWADARRHFERAISFAPEEETPSIYLYRLYQVIGDLEKGSAVLEAALELDPVSPNLNGSLANNLFLQGDYERSAKHGQVAYLYGSAFGAYAAINSMAILGKVEEAQALLRNVADERDLPEDRVALIESFIDGFSSEDGRRIIIAQARKDRYFGYVHFARMYGEYELANEISAEAVASHYFDDTISNLLDIADFWTPLPNDFRKTAAFKDLIRSLHIDDYWREFEYSPYCHAKGDDDFTCE